MKLSEFIENNKVLYSKDLIGEEDIAGIQKDLGVALGEELTIYLKEYGFLAYEHVELYGVNSKQKAESDMIQQTKYLHKYFPQTADYIALENRGDGDYILVGADDDISEFISEENRIAETGTKLFDYILSRFQEASESI